MVGMFHIITSKISLRRKRVARIIRHAAYAAETDVYKHKTHFPLNGVVRTKLFSEYKCISCSVSERFTVLSNLTSEKVIQRYNKFPTYASLFCFFLICQIELAKAVCRSVYGRAESTLSCPLQSTSQAGGNSWNSMTRATRTTRGTRDKSPPRRGTEKKGAQSAPLCGQETEQQSVTRVRRQPVTPPRGRRRRSHRPHSGAPRCPAASRHPSAPRPSAPG